MSDKAPSGSPRAAAPSADPAAARDAALDLDLDLDADEEEMPVPSSARGRNRAAVSSPVAHSMRRPSLIAPRMRLSEERKAEGGEGSSSDDGDGEGDDSGALLRSKAHRARSESRQAIAARYVTPRTDEAGTDGGSEKEKRARDLCEIPSIFGNSDEEEEEEEPLLGQWQLRAAAAVVRHRQDTSTVYESGPWGACSLSFRDLAAEKAFRYYFSSLNEHKLRRRLLMLNFLYMIYATVEWGTRSSSRYSRRQQGWITALRAGYILVNAVVFSLSFAKRQLYRRNIHLLSTILAVLTSTLIIVEGHLLRNIYSPFVLLVLVMYMVGSNIWARTLFSVSVAVCWYNLLLYNLVCLALHPYGDGSTAHSSKEALLQLFYYNLILLFFLFTILFQTRKVEKQNRYAFLQYYIEVEAEEKEAAEEEHLRAEAERRRQERRERKVTAADGSSARERDAASASSSPPVEDQLAAATSSSPSAHVDSVSLDVNEEKKTGVGPSSVPASASSSLAHRPHLLPRTKAEERALLRELNAAERAEDPFYISKVASLFLPQQAVTTTDGSHGAGGELTARTVTRMETVWSHDPLYTTLSLMRERGVTSMADFVRLLKHQARVRRATEQIGELPCICHARELPKWFTAYPYVDTLYRCNYTARMCARSIFQWHNETINIWTEFLPCILFIVGFIMLESVDPTVLASGLNPWDRYFALQALFLGLVVRPIASGLAHTFYVQSQRAFLVWWGVDYVSILLSILGYGLLLGRFTFFCMEAQQLFFALSVLVLFLSTIAAVLFVASPGIRTSSFILYVLFANGLPYIYQLVLSAADLEEHDVPKRYLVLWTTMWGLKMLGLLFKSTMVPERWWPGKFDVVGASHQLWHVLINAGAALGYFVIKEYLRWRPTVQCEPSYGLD